MALNTKAYEKMNYGLYLVSAAAEGKRHGCIVSSFAQVTSSYPAKFTITINKDHETCKAVSAAGSFSVTMLSASCPRELVNQFGYKSGRVTDKFADYEVLTDGAGNPYLKEHMVARVSCKVVDKLEIGSYILFVGQATEAEVLGEGAMLTLEAYTNEGRPVPSTATVYRTMENGGFRCTVCGFVYMGEKLPEGYKCPICGAPVEKFVAQ